MGAYHVRFVNSETKKCGKVFSSYLPTLTEAAAAEAAAVLEEAARRAREARTEEERADAVRRKQWILEQQMASSSGGDEGDDGSTSMSTSMSTSAMLMAVRDKLDELLRSQVVGAGGEISNDGPRTLELVASLLREEGKLSSAFK